MNREKILKLAVDANLASDHVRTDGVVWVSPYVEDTDIQNEILMFAEKLLESQRAELSQGATDVLAERQRQISVEGWTPEHDDEHIGGELAGAAACYILNDSGVQTSMSTPYWPYDWEFKQEADYRRMLVNGLALGLAELERRDRADKKSEITPTLPQKELKAQKGL